MNFQQIAQAKEVLVVATELHKHVGDDETIRTNLATDYIPEFVSLLNNSLAALISERTSSKAIWLQAFREAARSVCLYCRSGRTLGKDAKGYYRHQDATGALSVICAANGIHLLIETKKSSEFVEEENVWCYLVGFKLPFKRVNLCDTCAKARRAADGEYSIQERDLWCVPATCEDCGKTSTNGV